MSRARGSSIQCSHSDESKRQLPSKPAQPNFAARLPSKPKQALPSVPTVRAQPGKSNLSSSLAYLRKAESSGSTAALPVPRSATFSSRPADVVKAAPGPSRQWSEELEVDESGPQRGQDLTILEDLKPGPKEFGRDPEGEHDWLHLEPNSKIRLAWVLRSHPDDDLCSGSVNYPTRTCKITYPAGTTSPHLSSTLLSVSPATERRTMSQYLVIG